MIGKVLFYNKLMEASDKDKQIGMSSIGVGGLAIHKSRPLISGRTKLYHGTTKENVSKILKHGIHPSKINANSITGILPDDIKNASKDLAFTTKSKKQARFYGGQAEYIKKRNIKIGQGHAGDMRFMVDRIGIDMASHNPFDNKGIVKASVPLWNKNIAHRVVKNPEARGSFKEFSRARIADPISKVVEYNELANNTKAFKHGLPSRYIKGSKNYQKLGLKEIGKYIKTKPGRFGTGVTLGTAGVGAVGYGLHKLLKKKSIKESELMEISPEYVINLLMNSKKVSPTGIKKGIKILNQMSLNAAKKKGIKAGVTNTIDSIVHLTRHPKVKKAVDLINMTEPHFQGLPLHPGRLM